MMRALAWLAVLLPALARACPLCAAGDPTLTITGTEPLYAGRLRLALDARYGHTENADDHLEEGVLRGTVTYAPLERVAFFGAMPLVLSQSQAEGIRAFAIGPGDAEIGARLEALRDRGTFPDHRLGMTASLVMPTSLDVHNAQGSLLPLHAQTGRGVFAPSFGVWSMHSFDPVAIFTSATVRLPVASRWPQQPGPSLLAGVAVHWRALSWLTLRGTAEMRWDLRGTDGGPIDPDSGGVGSWLGGGLLFALGDAIVLAVYGRGPLVVVGAVESFAVGSTVMIDL